MLNELGAILMNIRPYMEIFRYNLDAHRNLVEERSHVFNAMCFDHIAT